MKMRMGAPKQKWTAEEECALRAGVEKYGPGKWRAIQRDPKFGPALVARSNVDLKDKWRNLSVSSGQPRIPRSKVRRVSKSSERTGSGKNLSGSSDSEEGEGEEYEDEDEDGNETPPVYNQRKQLGSRYDELVSEAILTLKEPNGSDISAIANYIEEHQRVPSRFRKLLTLKLKALTAQGKLVKVGKSFKVRDYLFFGKTAKGTRLRRQDLDETSPKFLRTATAFDLSNARSKMKTAEEAARLAAQAVADAEAAAAAAEQAAREAEAAEAVAEAAAEEAVALAARSGKDLIAAAPVPSEALPVVAAI
ncbi:telomere repeat-binding factor 1 [Selaginella moellendorffii]|nr:telomere repeat-binding factor 1 [Selaginella moellendorffii]XP_002989044.2 telomere repeat-binding factor 1 [Selaginella moellendorffii]XP_024518640.1 telomere repeat-binding factor 1 [Selaginella moellendorffii]|eukprot:XP_002983713.2 telomere repeat-binding factor 1 [Selaginella moellendorffii]